MSTRNLPAGTVTFLFTDIEGSTQLLHKLGNEYVHVLADHHRILREIFDRWNGREVDTEGDAFFVSFRLATEAVEAVVESQQALAAHVWPDDTEVRVRMGLHTGEPLVSDEGYVGMDVHRAARIAHVGHGGQVLLSETTAALVRGDLPQGVTMLDLGRHRLKDMAYPEHIRQLTIDGLPSDFPALKTLETLGSAQENEKPVRVPAFLKEDRAPIQETPFFGREPELASLIERLERVLEGSGGVTFIAGDAGSGKSALLATLAREAHQRFPGLLVAQGQCNAYTGSGEPYFPFRTAMRDLTGDVETRWKANTISQAQAMTLWEGLPLVAGLIVEYGSDLLDTFVPGPALLSRVTMAAPADGALISQLKGLLGREDSSAQALEQRQLFRQYGDVLGQVALERPLLILLDDLQWADSGSVNLLFHLSRELAHSRVLVVGAYRPEEVAVLRTIDGRAGGDATGGLRHPLAPILQEIQRAQGEEWTNLNESSGGDFVASLLDGEPNRLGDSFRQSLLQHTGGHALFTVELLREMRDQGDIFLDQQGVWREGQFLDWSTFPPRVEGVIGARIDRLDDKLRDVLNVAAVEGQDFTAQVVARVQEIQERKLLRSLSRELAQRHQLISEDSELQIGQQLLSRYRFAHTLFQRYLYNDLSAGERRLLHGEIGPILEELYEGRTGQIAAQLALHYAQAGESKKAVHYLILTGDQARAVYAYEEAAGHYEQALELVNELDDIEQIARIQMKLGLAYHLAFNYVRSRQAYDAAFALWTSAQETQSLSTFSPAPHALRLADLPPETLDPALNNDIMSAGILMQLFEGLVRSGKDGDIVPGQATSWEISEGGRKYVFYLRSDARWSDGRPLTAADFVYGWRRALNPVTGKEMGITLLSDVKGAQQFHEGKTNGDELGVRAADDHTLVIELDRPVGYFLYLLAHLPQAFPMVPQEILAHRVYGLDPNHLVGNGPFRLLKHVEGQCFIFERNPYYSGFFAGNLEQVEYQIVDDWQTMLDRYEKDDIDIFELFQVGRPENAIQISRRFASDYVSMPNSNSTAFLAINPTIAPFSDSRVRRALAMALDKEALVDNHLAGLFSPGTGGFLPPGMPNHSPEIGINYNPDGARTLLDQAGYPAGAGFPSLKAVSGDYALFGPIREYLQSQWRDVLRLEFDWDLYNHIEYRLRRDDYPLYIEGWSADYPDPDGFLRTGLDLFNDLASEQVVELLENARRQSDQVYRGKLYKKADRLIVEEAAIVPLVHLRLNRLVKPWLKRTGFSGIDKWRWKDVVIEPR